MKKILLFAIALFLCLPLWSQFQRKSLVEEFTNASCPPCASQNPAFNTLLKANLSRVVSIKFQTNFPGYDPMNEQNPGEVEARWNYYAQGGVPVAALDGTVPTSSYGGGGLGTWTADYAGGPYGFNNNVFNYSVGITTPIELLINHSFDTDLRTVSFEAKIINHGDTEIAPANLRLHIALVEHEINFPAAPGTNGEKAFEGVMRKMFPDHNGTSLTEALAPGDTMTIAFDAPIPAYIYDYRELAVVTYLQNHATKAIFQSEISDPIALDGIADASLKSSFGLPPTFCDNVLSASFEVENTSTETEITSLELEMNVNGVITTLPWEGTLVEGEPLIIDAADQYLEPGANQISARILSVNGLPDIVKFNSIVNPVTVPTVPVDPVGDSMEEDFEDVANYGSPENTILLRNAAVDLAVVDRSEFSTATWPIGAFEQSEKAILYNFYGLLPGQKVTMLTYKADLTGKDSVALTFDHAYVTYQTESDRLQIEVSTNCGDTWTSVFNKAGTTLSTGAAQTAFFVPRTARWRNNTVDLSNYNGAEELMVRFVGTSAYGNNLWLDNINLSGVSGTSSEEKFLDENALSVAPNPVRKDLNLILSLDEASDCQIVLQDLTGKNTEILERNLKLGQGTHNIQYNVQKPAGLYLLTLKTQKGQITQKVTIVE